MVKNKLVMNIPPSPTVKKKERERDDVQSK